ncbi:hypothetical protein J3U35_06235 [Gilliamella sp. B2717]|uniref:hypothetical protein n=1 Tax=Gilliamella sp. B2717 TaxID=2817996 RepID=UPI002269C746|nr:hypothetical protein [Gilliamella sp. B2717]MCX8579037.1 hypothetical protein [Gilliamella sp. B2717]
MKQKNRKLTKLLALLIAGSSLVGCYNKEEFKRIIQDGYDEARANTKVKGDFCYYLGVLKFPYTDEPKLDKDSRWTTWNKRKLSKSLPLFAEIGLLSRQPVEGQSGLYHYDLTDLGREYWNQDVEKGVSGPLYHNQFCYGPIVVDRVTDVTKKEYTRAQGYSYNEVNLEVDYEYHVIDVPDWVINNREKLNAVYRQGDVRLPNKSYVQTIKFYVGKDDKLYQNSQPYFQLKPSSETIDNSK